MNYVDINYDTRNKKMNKYLHLIVFGFLFFNILKITLFNFLMFEEKNLMTFGYKFLTTTILCIMIFTLLFQLKRRFLWYLLYLVQIIYIGGFLCYYNYFNSFFHLFQMSVLFPEGAAVVKHFSVPFYTNMLVAIIDLPFFVAIMVVYNKLTMKEMIKDKKKYIWILGILLFAILEIFNTMNKTSLYDFSKSYPKKENQLIEKYGTFINNFYDYFFNANGVGLLNLYQYGNEIKGIKKSENPPNILIIQVESLDGNIIHKKYNGELIAPYLSKIANENIYHQRMLSYHLAGGSSDAEYSVLNSVEALTSFPSMKLNSDKYLNSMPKQFIAAGYEAEAFHGNIGAFYNRTKAYELMGFDAFYDIDLMKIKDIRWGASDAEVFNFALDKIKKYKTPFFDYIITMTSHTPFHYVDDYVIMNDYDTIKDEGTRQYYKSIHYVDSEIEKFVNEVLKEKPNTVIVIFGDHTPGDLTDYKKSSFYTKSSYFEFVPLIIITPDKINFTNTEYAVSFLDVAPTILELSGIEYSIKSKGESLLSGNEPKSLIPFRGIDYQRVELIKMEQESNKK